MAGVSKLDYLKRYMDDDGKKKLKKKKKVSKHSNIRIIDDSISFNEHNTHSNHDEGEFDLKEEKPLVYAKDGTTVLTEEYTEKERLKKERWRSINSDNVDLNKGNDNKKLSGNKQTLSSQRHDSSDDDMSPVRQTRDHDKSSDSDLSPVRRPAPQDTSNQDLSPVRKRRDSSGDDLSPVRNTKSTNSQHRRSKNTSCKRDELLPEVLSTGKSGLRTGAELRTENELKRRREHEVMKNLGSDVTGKGAETVYREKGGKKIDLKFEAIKKRKMEEEQLQHVEKYAEWGKGVAQTENYKKQLKDDLHEMDKPLARHRDDKDLDNLLKERDRAGDPMAAFITKNNKQEEKSGKPRYAGRAPPNRFNIWPGYRYDGVDRSNGFEKQRFEEMGKRKGLKDAAYKWSVENM